MPECRYKLTEVDLLIGKEEFHWSGTTPTSPGFTAVYPWQEVNRLETNVEWNEGQCWVVEQVIMWREGGREGGMWMVGMWTEL